MISYYALSSTLLDSALTLLCPICSIALLRSARQCYALSLMALLGVALLWYATPPLLLRCLLQRPRERMRCRQRNRLLDQHLWKSWGAVLKRDGQLSWGSLLCYSPIYSHDQGQTVQTTPNAQRVQEHPFHEKLMYEAGLQVPGTSRLLLKQVSTSKGLEKTTFSNHKAQRSVRGGPMFGARGLDSFEKTALLALSRSCRCLRQARHHGYQAVVVRVTGDRALPPERFHVVLDVPSGVQTCHFELALLL